MYEGALVISSLILALSAAPQAAANAARDAAPAAGLSQAASQQPPAPPPQTGAAAGAPQAATLNDELWDAARVGDAARVTRALDRGADVNAKTRYGVTALAFAADKGHIAIIELLIARGADVNLQDSFYRMRAIDKALSNDHLAAAALLLAKGSKGAFGVLRGAVEAGDVAVVTQALAGPDLTAANVAAAQQHVKEAGEKQKNAAAISELLAAKAASMPADPKPTVTVPANVLQSYVGRYRNEQNGVTVTVAMAGDRLTASVPGQPALSLVATTQDTFRMAEADVTVQFDGRGGTIEGAMVTQNNTTLRYARQSDVPLTGGTPSTSASPAGAPAGTTGTTPAPAAGAPSTATASPATPASAATPTTAVARTAARPWPAFRGDNAAGNGDGQGAVAEWNVETGQNVRWKTPIPGISNSSPIVWGNRVFVATAISSSGDKTFKTGLYGDVAPVDDLSEHTWKVYCLDRVSGKILWERTAFTGLPKTKRHTKASQANSTPVTDGKRVVAVFGSIGLLAAWDMDGKPLWTADIGVLNSGWFLDPDYQWGHSSSPIIYRDTVIVQADVQKGSFLAAYNLATGKQTWRTDRDEIATWGTPTLFKAAGKEQLVTNGPKIRGYDPATGKLLWTLGPNSEITVGTPVVGDGLVYVTGGYPPVRPIYAIKPNASGEITMAKDQTTNDAIAWSNDREGTYIPTPLVYDGLLYTCQSNGILTAYDAKTGDRIWRQRVGGGGAFSASPVAADGRLYLASEDGDVYVVRAGRTYQELSKNPMNEVVMSTPAIADGVIVFRTLGHVYGIGEKTDRAAR